MGTVGIVWMRLSISRATLTSPCFRAIFPYWIIADAEAWTPNIALLELGSCWELFSYAVTMARNKTWDVYHYKWSYIYSNILHSNTYEIMTYNNETLKCKLTKNKYLEKTNVPVCLNNKLKKKMKNLFQTMCCLENYMMNACWTRQFYPGNDVVSTWKCCSSGINHLTQ